MNERSYPIAGTETELRAVVVSLLKGLAEAKRYAGDLTVGSATPLSAIPLTEDFKTLAAVLRGDREWWRFVHALDQRSPFSEVPQTIPPPEGQHVAPSSSGGASALLWAHANKTFLISFPSTEEWSQSEVAFEACACSDDEHLECNGPYELRNISCVEHASLFAQEIASFRFTEAVSSRLWSENGLMLRMFLNDHNPPHVHVYKDGVAVALVRFDCGPEILRGRRLIGADKARIFDLIAERKADLLISWERCRGGNLPNLL